MKPIVRVDAIEPGQHQETRLVGDVSIVKPLRRTDETRVCAASCKLYAAGRLCSVAGDENSAPDTVPPLIRPDCMVLYGATGTIYVSGQFADRVVAISCASNTKVASVPVPIGEHRLCVNQAAGKLYCTNSPQSDSGSLTVIDVTNNQVIAVPAVGSRPVDVCLSPHSNRVYCADGYPANSVTVVDGSTNQVVTTVPLGGSPFALLHVPRYDRVYCSLGATATVSVIDCATDTVVANLSAGGSPGVLCYNPANGKVYHANPSSGTVSVVDDSSLQVVGTITVGGGPAALCCNPQNDKVYCANRDSDNVSIIDGATNVVVATVPVGSGPKSLCYSGATNRIFVGNDYGDNLTVIDGATNAVLATAQMGDGPSALCSDSDGSTVYCSGRYSYNIRSINSQSMEVTGNIVLCYGPWPLCYNAGANRIYCGYVGSEDIAVIDGATNTVVERVPVSGSPSDLCYSSARNRIYSVSCATDTVTVIDASTNQVMATIPAGEYAMHLCLDASQGKLYCANLEDSVVTVIDCGSNTLLQPIRVSPDNRDLAYSPRFNKLYCAGTYSDTITVIDCARGSAVARVNCDMPWALVYDTIDDRVFCASSGGIVAIGASTDSVVGRLESVPGTYLCWDNVANRIYAADPTNHAVVAIDAATCQVAGVVPDVGGEFIDGPLMFDAVNRKVYYTPWDGFYAPTGTVHIIDAVGIVQVEAVEVGRQAGAMVLNPANSRVYVANGWSGTISVIRDSGGGGEEGRKPQATGYKPAATIVRSVLRLSEAAGGERSAACARLLDTSGRQVMELLPGPNDVRSLSPGVYFVREKPQASNPKLQAVQKVVITR